MKQSKQYQSALKILREGGVIAYPTDTTYGIGCDALNVEAVRRIFELKGRDYSKPLSLAFADIKMLHQYTEANQIPNELLNKLYPGPITLILLKKGGVSDLITAGSTKVGARIPDHFKIIEMIQTLGRPIVTTSANLSGKTDPVSAEEIQLPVDFTIKGDCHYKMPSTIIDVNSRTILRSGVNADYYQELLNNL